MVIYSLLGITIELSLFSFPENNEMKDSIVFSEILECLSILSRKSSFVVTKDASTQRILSFVTIFKILLNLYRLLNIKKF